MNTKPRILIFSVYQTARDRAINVSNHESVKALLTQQGVEFIELRGMYKNVEEQSLLVDASNRQLVEGLVADYNQESYLESHADRYTELVYADGERVGLGTLQPVSALEALELDSWSYNPILKQYYVVR